MVHLNWPVTPHSTRAIFARFAAVLLLGCIAAAPPATTSNVAAPRVFQCSVDALADARSRVVAGDPSIAPAIAALRKDADKSLNGSPFTIVHKQHPLPGVDVHDYVSLAPYFWPDPGKADGLPYIRRDGERNPEFQEYDARPLNEMSGHVYTLALAGYLTGDAKYSARAAELLHVWFFDPATRMNPNLDHAQLVKGTNLGRGTGIIETVRLLNVIDAVGMLRLAGQDVWSDEDQTKIEAWFRDYVTWLRTSDNGKAEAAAKNNHGSWYDVQLSAFELFLGDDAAAKEIIDAAKSKRIARQIEPNGEQPLELVRTKSFGYSTFNVSALEQLADLGEPLGVDLWHYRTSDGRCIQVALDMLIPYATSEQKWPHKQIAAIEPHGMLIPLRRAEAAYRDAKYEAAIERLKLDLSSDRDSLRFPPLASASAEGR
jgi:hypothetical protein